MNEICGDNRFEIIAKAKEHLLDATNIDTSEDEMKVLDNFLYRCWQMGWLDRYAEQTEPQRDDIGNCNICKYVGLEHRCNQCVNGSQFYKVDDEPQTDGYMTAEQTEDYRNMLDKAEHKVYGNIEDEPQTDCSWQKGE